jgi:hypothetical protein
MTTKSNRSLVMPYLLGHSLGLSHGGTPGGRDNNYKPNYPSIMNYAFQMPSLVPNRPLDYSRCAIPLLNESNLSEPEGIGPSCPLNLTTITFNISTDRKCSAGAPIQTSIAIDWNNDRDEGVDRGVDHDSNPCKDAAVLVSLVN